MLHLVHRLIHKNLDADVIIQLMNHVTYFIERGRGNTTLIALEIVSNLLRTYKSDLESWVEKIFRYIVSIYKRLLERIDEVFSELGNENSSCLPISLEDLMTKEDIIEEINIGESDNQGETHILEKFKTDSLCRLEILTECPLIVALLHKLYKNILNDLIQEFVSLTVECLEVYPKIVCSRTCENGLTEYSRIKNIALVSALVLVKIKALSFITYVQKNSPPIVNIYKSRIPAAVINLMKFCPPEAISERKEFLVAIKLIWLTELRDEFIPYIDTVIDPKIFIGGSIASMEYLKVAFHKIVADFICNVRYKLPVSQICNIIQTYSKYINDLAFTPSTQMIFFDVVVRLFEAFMVHPDKSGNTDLFTLVLRTFSVKYASMVKLLPFFKDSNIKEPSKETSTDNNANMNELGKYIEVCPNKKFGPYSGIFDFIPNSLREVRFMLKHMALSLRHVILIAKAVNLNQNPNNLGRTDSRESTPKASAQGSSTKANPEIDPNKLVPLKLGRLGTEILISIFDDGITCFSYWKVGCEIEDNQVDELKNSQNSFPFNTQKEEKETLELFATCFMLLEFSTFNEIVSSRMESLFEAIVENRSITIIPEYFLTNAQISPLFSSIILPFLLKKLETGGTDSDSGSVVIQLMELFFSTISLMSEAIIRVIQSHVTNAILLVIRLAFTANDVMSHFSIVKLIFNSICEIQSDILYSKVTPGLQFITESLLYFFEKAQDPEVKNTIVELLLMLPVRFNALVLYLPRLMKPLVRSLSSTGNLLVYGLKLMELCVDNLPRVTLQYVISPVLDEINSALRNHMRPPPYDQLYSHSAARILGKLGNLSRCSEDMISDASQYVPHSNDLEIKLLFEEGRPEQMVSLREIFQLSNTIISSSQYKIYLKREAFAFSVYCLPFFIDADNSLINSSIDLGKLCLEVLDSDISNTEVLNYLKNALENSFGNIKVFSDQIIPNPNVDKKYFLILIDSIISASVIAELKDEAEKLMDNICNYFSIVAIMSEIEDCIIEKINIDKFLPWITVDETLPAVSDFIDAITNAFQSKIPGVRELASDALNNFCSKCENIIGSRERFQSLKILDKILTQFCHSCYELEFDKKVAGSIGIYIIANELNLEHQRLREHVVEIVRALINCLKNSPFKNIDGFTESLMDIVTKCYQGEVLKNENSNTKEQNQMHANPLVSNFQELGNFAAHPAYMNSQDHDPIKKYPEFSELISFLVSNLSASNEFFRDDVKNILLKLAKISNLSLMQLKIIIRDELVAGIISRPLRTIPYAAQIGSIDAITFYLTIGQPHIALGEGFYTFLNDLLVLSGTHDQILMTKSTYFCSVISPKFLRMACIKLSLATLKCADFNYSSRQRLLSVIISTCIRLMYSKYPDVGDEACKCLKYITHERKIPINEFLRIGLKPIIFGFSDHEKLTLPFIQVFVKFLGIVGNNFKAEVCKKMFDHFKKRMQQINTICANDKYINYTHKVKIVVSIISVFHLLQPSSLDCLKEIVEDVISIEPILDWHLSNPFRKPCIQYLNCYPAEALNYFLSKSDSLPHMEFFLNTIQDEGSAPICTEAVKHIGTLLKLCIPKEVSCDRKTIIFLGILMQLCDKYPEGLSEDSCLYGKILNLWSEIKIISNTTIRENYTVEWQDMSRLILEIVLNFLKMNPDNTEILFEVSDSLDLYDFIDYTSIHIFIYNNFIVGSSLKTKKAIFSTFFNSMANNKISQKNLLRVMDFIIIPLLKVLMDSERLNEVVDTNFLYTFEKYIWIPMQESIFLNEPTDILLRLKVLNITSMLFFYDPKFMESVKFSVIKFLFCCINCNDLVCRSVSIFLLIKFVEHLYAPTILIYKFYLFLIMMQQFDPPHCGLLTFQTMNSLFSLLSDTSTQSKLNLQKYDVFPEKVSCLNEVKLTESIPLHIYLNRQIIENKDLTVSQLVIIYHIFIKFFNVFYDYMPIFLDPMIYLLKKFFCDMQYVSGAGILIIGTCEILITWLERFSNENPHRSENKGKDTVTEVTSNIDNSVNDNLHENSKNNELSNVTNIEPMEIDEIPNEHRSTKVLVVSVLIKSLEYATEITDKNSSAYSLRIIDDIKECLILWKDVDINIKYISKKLIPNQDHTNVPHICSMLQVLKLLLEYKPQEWILSNITYIQNSLLDVIKLDNFNVTNLLVSVISGICKVCEGKYELLQDLVKVINLRVKHTLRSVKGSSYSSSNKDQNLSFIQIYCGLRLFDSIFAPMGNRVNDYVPEFLNLLERLTNEINKRVQEKSVQSQKPYCCQMCVNLNSLILMVNLLLKFLSRAYMHNEQRKIFVYLVVNIIDNSNSRQILLVILNILRFWFSESPESVTSLKENMNLIVKVLLAFQKKTDPVISRSFLTLVADILQDQRYKCTEIISQLEPVFLTGTMSEVSEISRVFFEIISQTISPKLYHRLGFSLKAQSWELLPSILKVRQALCMALECAKTTNIDLSNFKKRNQLFFPFLTKYLNGKPKQSPENLNQLYENNRKFMEQVKKVPAEGLINSMNCLLYTDDQIVYDMWVELFPLFLNALNRNEQGTMERMIISLLCNSRSFFKNANSNARLVRSFLEAMLKCKTGVLLPPLLIKYLSKKFNCWHIGLSLLMMYFPDGKIYCDPRSTDESERLKEAAIDTAAEMLQELSEDDYFCGLFRQKCVFTETNSALSYEQAYMWEHAQNMYQELQRNALKEPFLFAESEQTLCSEHWITCAEKLQQWDILYDLAEHEKDNEYMIECLWHLPDWSRSIDQVESIIESLDDVPHQRRIFFKSYIALRKLATKDTNYADLRSLCSSGIGVIIKAWNSVPRNSTFAQLPLLHLLQRFSEIWECSKICRILSPSNISNIEVKYKEVKTILQTWRERLPSLHEDINVWTDTVHFRTHMFQIIDEVARNASLNIQNTADTSNGGEMAEYAKRLKFTMSASSEGNTSLYLIEPREKSWITCQFSRMLRKHKLSKVSREVLADIYNIKNVEVNEVASRLIEESKSYLSTPNEYSIGLEVINNANITHFSNQHKAEIFALKGIFLERLKHYNEAEVALYSSIRIQFNMEKGWTASAEFYDEIFKENNGDSKSGINAVNCYLQAAAFCKSAASRKFISRILWILSQDDPTKNIAKVFDNHSVEVGLWYWVFFIPQLISFAGTNIKHPQMVLFRICRKYPQSSYFHLRAAHENMAQAMKTRAQSEGMKQEMTTPQSTAKDKPSQDRENLWTGQENIGPNDGVQNFNTGGNRPMDCIEENINAIRSSNPFLVLSMESMLGTIIQLLKQRDDEDIYRLIIMLLNNGMFMLLQELAEDPNNTDRRLSPVIEANIIKLSKNIFQNHAKYKKAFDHDFIESKPNLQRLVERFREWRDNLEIILQSKAKCKSVERLGHRPADFENRYEDIEIPGQSSQLCNSNENFIKIRTFEPEVGLVKGFMSFHRKFCIRGHDGSRHQFIIQHPAVRNCRREDTIVQLLKLLNGVLEKNPLTKARNLQFGLQNSVVLVNTVRLISYDPDCISLQDVWETYCAKKQMSKDIIATSYVDWVKKVYNVNLSNNPDLRMDKFKTISMKVEIMEQIAEKYVPNTILRNHMMKLYPNYSDFWTIRKKFTISFAALTFVTYVFGICQRLPYRINFSLISGKAWTSELFLAISPSTCIYTKNEAVPFRYTPNIQEFITTIGTEGLFSRAIMIIARALMNSKVESLEKYLMLNLRDDILLFMNFAGKRFTDNRQVYNVVVKNAQIILKRAELLTCNITHEKSNHGNVIVTQHITDLISQAVNPIRLAQMDVSYMSPL